MRKKMMSKVMKRTKTKKKILPSPPLPSSQPSSQQKQKSKLTNEQGDKQEQCSFGSTLIKNLDLVLIAS
jgi:hypothetical protein